MNKTIAILGRQPKIGLAELECLFGSASVQPMNEGAALLDVDPKNIELARLGGSLKLCLVLDELATTKWSDIEKILCDRLPEHAGHVDGKLTLGISIYGLDVSLSRLFATELEIKKVLKNSGKSVRIVPNKQLQLNTAQLLHNNLTSANGWELCLIRNGDKTTLAQTVQIQDIEAYAARDQARPKRDAKIGMLPPKLAQIMINLAAGELGNRKWEVGNETSDSPIPNPQSPIPTLLDPFCGTGVVLQEAALSGFRVYGSDLEPRMVEYSKINYEWLMSKSSKELQPAKIEVADATKYKWQQPIDLVAAETYLGKALRGEPSEHLLRTMLSEISELHERFLLNLAPQIKSGTRLCLAVPAWRYRDQFLHLKTVDQLTNLGYTRVSLEHANWEDLIYWREGQQTARELVLLIKN